MAQESPQAHASSKHFLPFLNLTNFSLLKQKSILTSFLSMRILHF